MTIRGVSPRANRVERNSFSWLEFDTEDFNTAVTPPSHLAALHTVLSAPTNAFFNTALLLVAGARVPDLLGDVLNRGELVVDTVGHAGLDPLTRTADKYRNLLNTSLDTEQTAQMLGTSVEDVLRRLEERTLYGVPSEDGQRIPRFQFEEGQVLPGLEEVLPLMHTDLHPVAVQNWFTSPNTDLLVQDAMVSPRQWLLSGRNAADVARIAIDV